MPRKVLIADDEQHILDTVGAYLRQDGFEVITVRNGRDAVYAFRHEKPDLVILDVMMPEMDGLSACRILRARYPALAILMLTARHGIGDRVAGLEGGADDYVVKPFASAELVARIRALMRRTNTDDADEVLSYADLTLDGASRTVHRGEREVELTRTEFELLRILLRNADIVLSRETLYERVWGYDSETSSRSLDVYIGYLRQKLEAGGEPRLVQTVRGVGFVVRGS